MVLLTMTSGIVRAVEEAGELSSEALSKLQRDNEPSLAEPKEGNPISHSQLIDLSKLLKKYGASSPKHTPDEKKEESTIFTLDALLRGSKIYIPPPPPKKEPTPEYTALMTRLRREEEARAYERMLNPPPPTESFSQRFPSTPAVFSSSPLDVAEDEISYEEVHRQIILIINVLVSIIACSVFIWVAARHWSAPSRLALSMSGSGVVAVAEIVIYSGYVRRAREAKVKERKKPEVKEIVGSWVIDGKGKGKKAKDGESDVQLPGSGRAKETSGLGDGIKYRKGKHR